jgi:hypothetical protein
LNIITNICVSLAAAAAVSFMRALAHTLLWLRVGSAAGLAGSSSHHSTTAHRHAKALNLPPEKPGI